MDILKLLPPHNTMSEKITYIPTQRCRRIYVSQPRLPWHLLTRNLNCAKHNARSKHVEPHFGSSYASRNASHSSLQRHHILVHESFSFQAPIAEWNSLLVCAIQ